MPVQDHPVPERLLDTLLTAVELHYFTRLFFPQDRVGGPPDLGDKRGFGAPASILKGLYRDCGRELFIMHASTG